MVRSSESKQVRSVILVAVFTVVVIGAMLLNFRAGHNIAVKYAPLVDAVMHIKLEATAAHLWFEESISGDPDVTLEDVWQHLDEAEWFAHAMLEGGSNEESVFYPLDDPELRRYIETALTGIAEFRSVARDRWRWLEESGIGSEADTRFDQTFTEFLAAADRVKSALQADMDRNQRRFAQLQAVLLAAVAALGLLTAVVLRRNEKERAAHVSDLWTREENLRTTLDSIGDAVIATDTEGLLTRMNPMAENLTGWKQDEAVGRPLAEVFNIIRSSTGEPADNPVTEVLATGQVVELSNHTMLVARDGTRFQIADSAAPILSAAGGTTGVVLVFRDVTDKYMAQDALREREDYLLSVFRAAPAGIGVVKDRILTQVNDRVCWISGYDEAELIGNSSRIFYPDDEEFEKVGVQKYRLIKDHGSGSVETRWRHKDGHMVEILLSSVPMDPNDWSKGVTFSALDITERKRSEEALRDSEKRTRAIFNTIIDAVFLHPLLEEGFAPFADVNDTACSRYGYTRDEFLRLRVPDITKPDDASQHGKPDFRKTLKEKGLMVFETTHLTRTGEEIPVEIISSVVDLDGKPFILAVARDITERKRLEAEKAELEEQYAQAQRLESIGRLAGGVAHDFNNLLSPIIGYGEMVMEDTEEADSRYESVGQIVKAGKRARDLVRQLLAFGRKQTLAPRKISLGQTVAEMEPLLRRAIREDIGIRIIAREQDAEVKADTGQIEQVILNLAVNAADAMPEGGELTFETELTALDTRYAEDHPGVVAGQYVMLAVSDTGEGMDKAIQAQIFDPFFSTKGKQGTGLGLATVYGIIKQHGGNIWVYSEPVRGTTFKIYLPVSREESVPAVIEVPVPDDLTGNETILLVEDDEAARKLFREVLSRRGYTVLAADNGKKALAMLDRHEGSIGLLLTDVIMPEMNGKELYERVCERCPGLKALFMSGYTDDVIARQGVLDAGTAFIQKPFTINRLAGRVRGLLDQ